MHLYGGTVWIEGEREESGSVIKFTIPIVEDWADQPASPGADMRDQNTTIVRDKEGHVISANTATGGQNPAAGQGFVLLSC